MAKTIRPPEFGLSVAHIGSDSRHVDWRGLVEEFDEGAYEIILPAPTYGDWSDHVSEAPAEIERIAKRYPRRPLSDDHREQFEELEAYYEWRDSFEPMMNYAWPVTLAYRLGEEEAAEAIGAHAGATTLLRLSDEAAESLYGADDAPEYVIALTGGGMDLSADIAAAYLCCGCIPPERLLERLSGTGRDVSKAVRPLLRLAYREAAAFYRKRVKRLVDEARRVLRPAA